MGLPMAVNLKNAGFEVKAFDLSPHAIAAGKDLGIQVADNLNAALENTDVVISMLPSSPHVEKLYLGEDGLLEKLNSKTLLIDSSTIAPQVAQKVQAQAQSKGFEMIDAPVSGGTAAAKAGTLTFMVGGSNSALSKATPLLEKMGKKIFHAGESGAGQTAKVCNNMLLAIHMIGTAEALQLGKACGIDPKVLSEIMLQSSGKNWSLEVYNPYPGINENVPSSKNYEGGFAVDLMTKDLGLAEEAALASHSSAPMGQLARNLYRIHSQKGFGKKDFSSIIKMFTEE